MKVLHVLVIFAYVGCLVSAATLRETDNNDAATQDQNDDDPFIEFFKFIQEFLKNYKKYDIIGNSSETTTEVTDIPIITSEAIKVNEERMVHKLMKHTNKEHHKSKQHTAHKNTKNHHGKSKNHEKNNNHEHSKNHENNNNKNEKHH